MAVLDNFIFSPLLEERRVFELFCTLSTRRARRRSAGILLFFPKTVAFACKSFVKTRICLSFDVLRTVITRLSNDTAYTRRRGRLRQPLNVDDQRGKKLNFPRPNLVSFAARQPHIIYFA